MKKLRLVKIKDKRTDKVYYQIQKKTFLFGWVGVGKRNDDIKGTFESLEEANKYYDAYTSGSNFKTEILK